MELPIFLSAGKSDHGGVSAPVSMGVAGPTAMVRLDDVDAEGGAGFSFYVAGPCGYYFPQHHGTLNSTLVWQQYTGIWGLSSTLTGVVDHFSIHPKFGGNEVSENTTHIPVRANATCSSRGHLLLIIGGVDLLTGEALDTVDVYDTKLHRYTPGAANLNAAVQNPLVAVDSELIYVAGGETRLDAPKEEASDTRSCAGTTHETQHQLLNCNRVFAAVWYPSATVQAIVIGNASAREDAIIDANMSLPDLVVWSLPSNSALLHTNVNGSGVSRLSNRYMFRFNGKLCLLLNVSFVNCLDVEQLLGSAGLPNSGSKALTWQSLLEPSSVLPVSVSTPFAFTLSVGVLGAMLVFFEFGGFDLDSAASARVFYRSSGIGITSVPNIDAVVPVGKSLRLTLHPPIEGYVRLSNNPLCIGNAAGTSDVHVFRLPEDATVAEFQPRAESGHVYTCFSNGPVWLFNDAGTQPCNPGRKAFLFTPIKFTQFQIRDVQDPFAPQDERDQSMYIMSLSFSIVVGIAVVVIAVFVFARLRQPLNYNLDYAMHLLGERNGDETEDGEPAPVSVVVRDGRGKGEVSTNSNKTVAAAAAAAVEAGGRNAPFKMSPPRLNPKLERDSLVKNTTNWSRYEVLQRIGEGAFSSVYLVRRKSTCQKYALKFLVCKDNKERLDAIRECETINSLQGHPNIIRLVDMFMNYEFDWGHSDTSTESPSVLVSPPPATLAAPPPQPQLPRWNAVGIKRMTHNPRVVMTLAGAQPPRLLHEQKPREVPQLQPPSSVGHVLANPPVRLTAASIQDVQSTSATRRQPQLNDEDGEILQTGNAAFQCLRCPMQSRDENIDEAVAAKADGRKPSGFPAQPLPSPASTVSVVVASCANSRLCNELGSSGAPRRYRTHRPDGHAPALPVGVPPPPRGEVMHYSNFAQVSHADASLRTPTTPQEGLSLPQKRTSYAPRGVIHYKDFDASLAAAGNVPAAVQLPVNNNDFVVKQTPTYAPLLHMQPAVGKMQYKNFISPDSGTNEAANKLGPMTKPKSVAAAVRAARMTKLNEGTRDVVVPCVLPNPTTVIYKNALVTTVSPAATTGVPQPTVSLQQPQPTRDAAENTICCSPNIAAAVRLNEETFMVQHRQQQQQQQQREEGRELLLKSAANKSPMSVPRPLLGVAHDVARLTTPGTSEGGPVHTRYLCLVMEYHPMGDLCGYVLRHSVKHNAKLKRQLEEDKARFMRAQEEDAKKMEHDAATPWVQLGSESDSTPSFFRPGKSSRSASHETQCQSPHDRTNDASQHVTAGSWSCSNVDLALGIGSNSNLERVCEAEFAMRGNALSEPQLLSIAYQLSSVLHHLHSQRPPIVHRDLKPENILICGEPPHGAAEKQGDEDEDVSRRIHSVETDGDSKNNVSGLPSPKKYHCPLRHGTSCSVKISDDVIPIVVTDFGLAFMLEDRRRAGRGGGTRPYIAPECWNGQTTTASDIWSLGCLLYALATARVTLQTVRIMYEEAKNEGFAAMIFNDILAENYSKAFACFVVSLLVINHSKRPSAEMVMRCFMVDDVVVRFNPNCPFFSNVLDL
ncbi:protein kinase [Trypanosoma rangeli SC58]|uniref:non-specific serine/threonine protein kinase n=1 Tax=Trypanosoma rangeli SC58 TaxID=429131 RepID=A0A061J017_TRYRA|nr:protein kinase [Trypanosoma rangeli SC58]